MTTVILGRGGASEPRRDFKGQWWLPRHEENRVGGTLEYAAGETATLELHGGLVGDRESPLPEVILGLAGGKSITISQAYYGGHTSQGMPPHSVVTRESWLAHQTLIGLHAPEGPATRFDYFQLETANLPRWVSASLPKVERSPDRLVINVDVPAPLTATVAGVGEIELWWRPSENHKVLDGIMELHITPLMHFRPTEPITFEQAWGCFVTPVLFLLSMATGTPDRIAHMHVGCDDSQEYPYGRAAEVLTTSWTRDSPKQRSTNYWEHLLPFGLVQDKFEVVVQRWFEVYGATQDSLVDFFSVDLTPFMYAEERFTRVVRSLESFHRARMGGTHMDPPVFNALLKTLLEGRTGPERSFINMRLKYANEPTLKARLVELIGRAGEPVASLLASYDRFPRRVVDTRNSLAHEGTLGEAYDDHEVFWAEKSLQQVFKSVLLRELGLTDDEVAACVQRSEGWSWLADKNNRLAHPEEKQGDD